MSGTKASADTPLCCGAELPEHRPREPLPNRALAGLALALTLAAGCGAVSSVGESDDWVGMISTEGDVTTVVNEAGSLWGGAARLVEEASIGVAEGADEYMLGAVSAITFTDEKIYVVDSQVPTVRVYDRAGRFLRNVGQAGDGPGEFRRPSLLAVDETSGRIFVFDARTVKVFDAEGEPTATWQFPSPRCCVWPMYSLGPERLWAPVQRWIDGPEEREYGAGSVGPDGQRGDEIWLPDLEHRRALIQISDGYEGTAPFSSWVVWSPTPDGGLLVGASDRYRFRLLRADETTLVVERSWDPVPVLDEQREWERRRTVTRISESRRMEWNWDGSEMPAHKPAYRVFLPSLTGEIWVLRAGESRRQADCAEDPLADGYREAAIRPCWIDRLIVDVFASDGRLLGQIDELPHMPWAATMNVVPRGNELLALVQDEAGIFQVKRYRVEVPDGSAVGEQAGTDGA